MSDSSIKGIEAFQASVETFIRVDPNGFLVNSFETSQLSQLTIGTSQILVFNPSLYSIDLDTNTVASNSSYQFYCTIVDNGVPLGYPKLYENVYMSLATAKINSYSNEQCFSDLSKTRTLLVYPTFHSSILIKQS